MYASNKQRYPILGAGLWGEVLDAGDYVIKFSKRRCAGIGDGRAKVQREAEVLYEIARSPIQADIAFAQLIGWGALEEDKDSTQQPTLWLKATKLLGQPQTVQMLTDLTSTEKRQVARAISSALCDVHKQLACIELSLPTPSQDLQTICEGIGGDVIAQRYVQKLVSALTTLRVDNTINIHGDFNLSNLLFKGNNICGVVDFAETRQGFVEEDLAAIVADLPAYRNMLMECYENCAGCSVSERRLDYGLAFKAFLSFAIARRLRNHKAAQDMEKKLHRCLQRL